MKFELRPSEGEKFISSDEFSTPLKVEKFVHLSKKDESGGVITERFISAFPLHYSCKFCFTRPSTILEVNYDLF